ncbi:MAG: DMT family transporter [Proteobacteria bacterium]|nr:DMT family transporter [Pseudomonadota bacterium]MDA1286571.1 DMT family transporter [Pseudomonadota bacterium]NQW14995.1 DMT family transporter [Rhodobacter sp.]
MDFRSIFMGLAFVLMWSSAFTSARMIVHDAPPFMALSIRFLISGIIAISIAAALGQSWRLSRRQWTSTAIFGVCQNALYLGLFFVAMQWIEAGLASIIASSMPLLVALLSWIFLKEKTAPLGILGLMAGFGGVALIMSARLSQGADPLGLAICAIGVMALAVATLAVRGASSGGNLLMIVGLQMLVGSAVLVVPALALETFVVNWSWQLVLAFLYTTLIPGLTATWVWFVLVGRIGTTRASTYHFLNPFFGVAIAAVLLGEHLSLRDFIGVAIVTAGIFAVQISKRPAKA